MPPPPLLASLPVAVPAGTETARTRDEERAALEAELGAALGEFDELLLREQDRVRAARPPADVTAASGGGDGHGEADGSGGGAAGDACSADAPCGDGLRCVTMLSGANVCRPLCDVSAAEGSSVMPSF